MSLNRTKIDWCDYSWNPVTGCNHGCPYCYARKIAERFRGTSQYPNGFEPTLHEKRLKDSMKVKKGSKIFVCSMADLFGDWVKVEWIEKVIEVVKKNKYLTFMFLTKNPKRYKEFNFPKNCWLGATITSNLHCDKLDELKKNKNNVKFVSFEPLLQKVRCDLSEIDMIIIGPQTNPNIQPKKEWVAWLIAEARSKGCAVFLKNKLDWSEKINEFPKEVGVSEY